MKKIVLFALLFIGFTHAYSQDVRLGFQASPVFSWMTTNDNTITGNGSNTGLKIGLIAENFFQENYAVTSGFGLVFNQGGTINHKTGGNFFPKSDLSRNSTRHQTPHQRNRLLPLLWRNSVFTTCQNASQRSMQYE